ARALDEAGGEVGPHQRAGDEAAAELGEDDHPVGGPEPDAAARLGLAQREDAHLRELAPEPGFDGALALELAQRLHADAPVAEVADASAQRLLVLAQPEIHFDLLRSPSARCAHRLHTIYPARLRLAARIACIRSTPLAFDPPRASLALGPAPLAQRSLGSPRMRSAMMLRCTCEEPAAIVSESDCIARKESSRDGSPPTSSRH